MKLSPKIKTYPRLSGKSKPIIPTIQTVLAP
jgi:hypothetical protein